VEALVGVGVGLVEARRNESKEPGPGLSTTFNIEYSY
jgi:hypothetical protein